MKEKQEMEKDNNAFNPASMFRKKKEEKGGFKKATFLETSQEKGK